MLKEKVFLLFVVIFFIQCGSDQLSQNEIDNHFTNDINEVPDLILEKSEKFIISYLGEDFFENYVSFTGVYDDEPYYLMHYNFKMSEFPYVKGDITFAVDPQGNVIEDKFLGGLPDCINFPQECEFPIDENQALAIAHEAGLRDGIKDLITQFGWFNGDNPTYIWAITSILEEGGDGLEGRGEEIQIDANSGEVLQMSEFYFSIDKLFL